MSGAPRQFGEAYVYSVESRNLDSGIVRELRRDLLYSNVPQLPLIIDLDGVEFVDTSGLGLLCSLKGCLGEAVVLAFDSAQLDAILDRIPANRLPARYKTVDQACKALSTVEYRQENPTPVSPTAPLHSPSSPFDHWYVRGETQAHGSDQ